MIQDGSRPHAKGAKDAKKESSLGPKPAGLSSGRPLTIRSIPFLRWTSPKLIRRPRRVQTQGQNSHHYTRSLPRIPCIPRFILVEVRIAAAILILTFIDPRARSGVSSERRTLGPGLKSGALPRNRAYATYETPLQLQGLLGMRIWASATPIRFSDYSFFAVPSVQLRCS